ncbi:MAG: hypothetical protein H7Y32_08845, partial [Chloroflexales bacterium]|nr:hypothetical protein [Chloroflexales bacterium]
MRHWIGGSERNGSLAPPFALGAHVLGCSTCRGAVFALLATLAPHQHPAPIACIACQRRLDGFIDCERQHGSGAALKRDPAVWWHLWTCSTCAEIYHLTTTLIDAEAQGALPPIASALPGARRRPRIAIEL